MYLLLPYVCMHTYICTCAVLQHNTCYTFITTSVNCILCHMLCVYGKCSKFDSVDNNNMLLNRRSVLCMHLWPDSSSRTTVLSLDSTCIYKTICAPFSCMYKRTSMWLKLYNNTQTTAVAYLPLTTHHSHRQCHIH